MELNASGLFTGGKSDEVIKFMVRDDTENFTNVMLIS